MPNTVTANGLEILGDVLVNRKPITTSPSTTMVSSPIRSTWCSIFSAYLCVTALNRAEKMTIPKNRVYSSATLVHHSGSRRLSAVKSETNQGIEVSTFDTFCGSANRINCGV